MGLLSAVEPFLNETAMHVKALSSNRLARGASHGPIVRVKERVKRTRDNPKEKPKEPKVPKGRTSVKPRKLVYQVLKTRNQRRAQKLGNLHRRIPLTTLTLTIPVKESLSVIMIEQKQFCALPRTVLCEAKVGQDKH